jgi:imidazole glycerol-phosphate synthase subunit HisH
MTVAIIKYNAGNTCSVGFALERLGIVPVITDDWEQLQTADKIIFPGVGEASTAMQYLKERNLDTLIKNLQQPVLGICLGMQLMCTHSEENDTACLGIFDTEVKKFNEDLKVPQMGWNKLKDTTSSLFTNLPDEPYCYFVHSYYADCCQQTTAVTEYGNSFSASLEKDNFYGVQFHPEKSATVGEQILKNFLKL